MTAMPGADDLAALADVVLDLAHRLDIRNPALRDVVPLTGTEIAVLREVHRTPGTTPSQVAEVTGLARSNVSTAIRTLETGGLVIRRQTPDDARSVTLVATRKAQTSIARINAYWAARLAEAPADAVSRAVAAVEALREVANSLDQG